VIRLALLGLLLAACAPAATTYVPSNISPPPVAREFRGAWVASVNNIDWPSQRNLTTQRQKDELLAILDKCVALKLNVVVLQVRPACDALYASKIEPWSEYLTGEQGRAPSPFWDPLEFAVREAHERGLELHAWFNPFRARHSTGSKSGLAANHISKTRPELAKSYGAHLWLDPGLQEVHDYCARVILDVVRRYDIDGVHIDDYFYPYPEKDSAKKEIPFPDWTSWGNYQKSGGKLARDDWRRDNVNRFIARLYRDVHAAKPWVKVGVSPFGIYRPGFPAPIRGFDQYQSLYADPRTWLVNGWVDYLAPQLYWRIDPPAQSFPVLLKWWAENNPRKRVIVAGLNTTAGWPAGEILHQIEITRQQPGVAGHIHWNMSALMKNEGGVEAPLRNAYAPFALAPALPGGTKPPAPQATARVNGSRAEFDVTAPPGAEIRHWLMQTRRDDGAWEVRIHPARTPTWPRSPAPSVFAVRAVDKFGNLSEATVLQRSEVQPRKEVSPRRESQPRRGK
jgi:uncharacterized lipoprotein YddW (UPF0748 family)